MACAGRGGEVEKQLNPQHISFFSKVIDRRIGKPNLRAGRRGHREDAMKFGATAIPQQIDAMSRVVFAHCRHIGIAPGTPEEEHIASLVLALHEVGVRGENDLLRALIAPDNMLPGGATARQRAA